MSIGGLLRYDSTEGPDGDASDAAEVVAVYAYDGMGRRLSKSISNQGLWAVPGSTVNGAEPLPAGDRVEHYYYDGWELVERRGPGASGNGEGTPATGQWVYGVTRIDEPLRYDRNTDPSDDGSGAADGCLESIHTASASELRGRRSKRA
ncbi:MAG: hypothetical protein SF069_14420 [Phycisphaerae bacterium]|nr:hypothetical protein [Phycisphaerae bacterium]